MNQRQAQIVELLASEREVQVRQLADRFGVTPVTIRRDLDELQRQGRLQRSHGSASLTRAGVIEFNFAEQGRRQSLQKQAIARAVAGEVRDGMVVALDTGSTTLEVARAIHDVRRVTVLTTSLPIAAALYSQEDLEVILMGGSVRKHSPDLSGVLVEQNLRAFKADMAVLGADAALEDGVYTGDTNIARGTRAMMAGAERRVLAIDSTKFQARALYRYAKWDEFQRIVTDDGAPAAVRQWLDALPVPVQYAPVRTPAPTGGGNGASAGQ